MCLQQILLQNCFKKKTVRERIIRSVAKKTVKRQEKKLFERLNILKK